MARPTARWTWLLVVAAVGPATAAADGPLPAGAVVRLGDTRLATAAGITDADFSADGLRLATADGVARVWDCSTGLAVWAGSTDGGRVGHVAHLGAAELAVDPWLGGQRVAVVDAATGRPVRAWRLDFEPRPLLALAASADGTRVATGGDRLLLFDAVTTRRLADLGPFRSPDRNRVPAAAATVCFSADGRRLYALTPAGRTAAFDAATGRPLDGVRPFDAPAGAAWSADGKTVLVDGAHLMDVASGLPIDWPKPPATRPAITAFAPTGGLLALAAGGVAPRVALWDTAARPPVGPRVLPCRVDCATGLAWSRDGRRLAVYGGAGRPDLLDVATGRSLLPPLPHQGRILAMAVSPDGRSAVLSDAARAVDRWDLTTGQPVAATTPAPSAVADALVFAGGDLLVGDSVDHVLRCDPLTLATTAGLPDAPAALYPAGIAFSADGRRGVRRVGPTDVRVWDVATGRAVWRSPDIGRATIEVAALAADGSAVAVGGLDSPVHLFHLPDGRATVLEQPAAPGVRVQGLRFSPDGSHLFAGGVYGFAVWDLAGGPPTPRFTAVDDGYEADFSPDGELLAVPMSTAGPAGATVYEVDSGRPVAAVHGHAGRASIVRFVPGRSGRFVTAADDGTAVVWDLWAALRATPAPDDRSAAELWQDLSDADPAVGYRAGVALLDRGRLTALAGPPPATGPAYDRLVADLSAADAATRERAHRQLEAAGPAAVDAVRRGLAAHPGGEAEARLSDLARLATPADPAAAVRRRRARELLAAGDGGRPAGP